MRHQCFETVLSYSPLVQRTFFDAQDLINTEEIAKQEQQKNMEDNPILKAFQQKEKAENLSPLGKRKNE